MSHQKLDRRVQRTRKVICDALIELMLEKSYEKITVQEIIDRANVGRATFYSHYQDKDDLLLRGVAQISHPASDTSPSAPSNFSDHTISTIAMFNHSRQNDRLHQVMFKRNRENPILEEVTQFLYSHIEAQLDHLTAEEQTSTVPHDVMAHFITGGLLSVIHWWHDKRFPYTAEEMDHFFQQIAMLGTLNALGRTPTSESNK